MATPAKKITSPAPKIHPELVKEIKKKPKPKKKTKPIAKKSKPVSKRVKLVSIKEASSVIDQIRIAFGVSAIGSLVGIILGSIVPLTTFMVAHYEWKKWLSIYTLLVAGGLLFSANSVFSWTKSAFRSSIKALGFVVLVEGAMICSKIVWVGYLGLAILIGINAVASGANLVIKPAPKKPSWETG